MPTLLSSLRVPRCTQGQGLPAGPYGLLGVSEALSFLSLRGSLLVFPLRELGVIGDPKTATVNVPELTESVRVALVPLVTSAATTASTCAAGGLRALEWLLAESASALFSIAAALSNVAGGTGG